MKFVKISLFVLLAFCLAFSAPAFSQQKASDQIIEQVEKLENIEKSLKTAQEDLNTVKQELSQSQQNLTEMNKLYLESVKRYEKSQQECKKWKIACIITGTIVLGMSAGAGTFFFLSR